VSRANLGAGFSLVAGAALIVDYTLTVSVSIAAGVGALTSAFPSLTSATVPICLAILAVITVLNLRGLGASARAFLLPTMLFIVGLLAVIAVGLIHPLGLKESLPGRSLLQTHGLQVVSVLLILKAFSAGLQRADGCGGDRQRRTALSRAPRQARQAHRDDAGLDPRRDAVGSGRPRPALAHRTAFESDGPEPDHGDGGGTSLGVLRRVLDDHGRPRARR